jgi:hypothetical protein
LEEGEGSPELEDIHSPHVVPCRARLRAAPTGFLAAACPSILLPLPLLCARGSWRPWQVVGPRRLQESLHRAKSEGGGGRRDFRVVNPVASSPLSPRRCGPTGAQVCYPAAAGARNWPSPGTAIGTRRHPAAAGASRRSGARPPP